MIKRTFVLLLLAPWVLSGCALFGGSSRAENRASSSLVEFLYPSGRTPPREDSIPELRLPLRVGLAFLPSKNGSTEGLEAARREALLERIRARFVDRKFVSRIEIVPDYYLKSASGIPGLTTVNGFDGLAGVQRLYNVDVMALVSYDQVTYRDENNWSLGYLTIVGAYVLKGNRHDVTTLLDLAVVDPVTRSIVLRAGGTDTRHGNTTLVKESSEARESRGKGFSGATDQLIDNFDAALTKFESDVRAGKANVRVVSKQSQQSNGGARNGNTGGGGALDWLSLLSLTVILAAAFPLRAVLTPKQSRAHSRLALTSSGVTHGRESQERRSPRIERRGRYCRANQG